MSTEGTKEERKARVPLKTTAEEFVKNWFKLDGRKDALADVYGGVTPQTIGKYAANLRKAGVKLPFAKRVASGPRAKAPVDVAGLNALIKSLVK